MSYCEDPQWSDVEPIPQDDGHNPLVPISYKPEYSDAMDFFRAIIRKNEKSERVLGLLADIIEMNPAHYTAWHYRQEVIFAIGASLEEELAFTDAIASEQAKNYQVWHHRQVIVDRLGDGSRELQFIGNVLKDDPKNYHAWAYRQWVVTRFNLWKGELDYVTNLLEEDVRNNAAWNHRYFILFSSPQDPSAENLEREIEFTQYKIRQAPNNPSSWAYLGGLLKKTGRSSITEMNEFLAEMRETGSPHALAMTIDGHEELAKSENKSIPDNIVKMCDTLANELDVVRQKYWTYRRQQLQHIH